MAVQPLGDEEGLLFCAITRTIGQIRGGGPPPPPKPIPEDLTAPDESGTTTWNRMYAAILVVFPGDPPSDQSKRDRATEFKGAWLGKGHQFAPDSQALQTAVLTNRTLCSATAVVVASERLKADIQRLDDSLAGE
jgi:hypothetical protein